MRFRLLLLFLLAFAPAISQQQGLLTNAGLFLPVPSTQASSIVFTNVTDNSMTVSFTRGNGLNAMLIGKAGSAVNATPVSNTTYTASPVFASGSQIGTGNYVLSNGTSASINITGLSPATTYHFFVHEYNGNPGGERYNINTATGNPASQVTETVIVAPTTQATLLGFAGDRKVSWTRGDGANILVLSHEGGVVDTNPTDGVTYNQGDELGTDNFVVYKGTAAHFEYPDALPFSTLYGFRAYEFNGANGSEKYLTTTATGNPLAHTTIADSVWYLYHDTTMMTRRKPYNLVGTPTDSRSCTQIYSIGTDETADSLFVYAVTEGDFDGGIDRSVRMAKDKTDGLPITQGWVFESYEANGDPTSFLDQGPDVWNAYQNWGLMSVVDLGGGEKIGYFVANGGSAQRYNVGHMLSHDDGQTWARGSSSPVIAQTSGRSMFYVKVLKDGSDWWMFAQNYNPSALVEGHLYVGEIWHSTDGLAWTKQTTTDIFAGRGLYGAVDIGQPWKEGSKYYAYLNINGQHISGAYNGQTGYVTTNPVGDRICLISWDDWATFSTDFIIEREIFRDSQAIDIDVRAFCQKQTFAGKDFVWTMSFLWRAQTGLVGQIEPLNNGQILSRDSITSTGGQFVGREVYPSFFTKLFLPHQSYLEDTIGDTPVLPKEIMSGSSGSIVGAPQQARLNSIQAVDDGFVTYPNFDYDDNQFAVKVKVGSNALTTAYGICGMDTDVGGGTHGWHIRKTGLYTFEIRVYGSNTTWKQYRVNFTNFDSGFDRSKFVMIGFIWDNGTLKVCVDLNTNCTVTKVRDDVFTAIQQTDEPLRMGAIYPTTNDEMFSQDVVGTMLFMDGAAATESNYLNNDGI